MNGASRKPPINPRGVPTENQLRKWKDNKYFIRTLMTEDTLFIVAANLEGDGHYWMALQTTEQGAAANP